MTTPDKRWWPFLAGLRRQPAPETGNAVLSDEDLPAISALLSESGSNTGVPKISQEQRDAVIKSRQRGFRYQVRGGQREYLF